MPKVVSEIMQGRTFERTSQGGVVSDSAQRQWKIVLSEPNEGFDVTEVIGVRIGDPFHESNTIPCVSISVAADGDSRMVRIATARYATQPGETDDGGGGGGGGGDDPGLYDPASRLAKVNITTSMLELPSWTWIKNPGGNNAREAAVNPCEDMYEGIIRVEPITVLTIEQFDIIDPTSMCQHVGKVNSNQGSYKGLNFPPRTLLFRGLTARPATEFWGPTMYRGYQSVYEFAFRRNVQNTTAGGETVCGWDMAIPQTGWNAKVDGVKLRATVRVKSPDGALDEWVPSGAPVALNDDGTVRNAAPLVYRRGYADGIDFSSVFAHLRLPTN